MWLKEVCLVGVLLFALAESASRDRNNKPYKVVCYLGSWANYRPGDGKFVIEAIDPFLCTHLIYGFAKLSNNQIAAYDPYLDLKENWGLGAFNRFNNLKKQNTYLTTLIAIGGWNEGSTKYSEMASNAASRATFIKSVIDFCQKYDFDGLDMDWEYPANRGGAAVDKQNYVQLLKEMKEAFEPHGLLLTAAVAAGQGTIDTAYDIPQVSKYLDFINVMAYDLHGSWEKFTGHNAPLYPRKDEQGDQRKLNVDYAMTYWKQQGADPKKLILGMGTYGRSFTLASASENGMGAPAPDKGAAGPITREGGMLGYNEICADKGWTTVFHEEHRAPYAFKDRQWVGYDNERSIEEKCDYAIKNGFGGGMIWSLETDDFRGKCHGHKYPLLTKIAEKFNGPIERVTVEPEPTGVDASTTVPTQPPQPQTTETDDGTVLTCSGEGFFRHPKNCQKFYHCQPTGNGYRITNFSCSDGLAFDESIQACNYKHQVKGCE